MRARPRGDRGRSAKQRALGQHFLTDASAVERIFAALDIEASDHVLEIGPGAGALTTRLVREAGSVVAVEVDRDLATSLRARLPGADIVCADALKADLGRLLGRTGARRRVVGNLPYNIASPLILRLFDDEVDADDMHFMVQAEVARRLAAVPGSKTYGRLSVIAQWHCRIELLFEVGSGSFSPPPKVRSAFVRLEPRPLSDRLDCDSAALHRVVRIAFGQRRKTLANALESVPVDWNALHIDPRDRPEDLSVADFVAIAHGLTRERWTTELTRERI
ncbi:MAG: 16S rRNA (adenine(1518)-N(6)/adenine(1519)-N(6))-dimethyltransferase RsmA [Gammaproteobacteria bacterium]|nr:16S rRNA (adenine(1518)-N(6)/adenine(1519)-N(6))-dimethyltransferase RsmA [Gammaproteobacteria bacterium]